MDSRQACQPLAKRRTELLGIGRRGVETQAQLGADRYGIHLVLASGHSHVIAHHAIAHHAVHAEPLALSHLP